MQKFEDFWGLVEGGLLNSQPLICAWQVLPGTCARKSGVVISIASRAATVDVPFGIGYAADKTGLVRAIASLQAELEIDGLGEVVHTYALHPGGVKTTMGGSNSDPDVVAKYPRLDRSRPAFQALFKDKPELCAHTCAYISTGKAKDLRGLYIDCRQDLGRLLEAGRESLLKNDLYCLKVGFLDGYSNEP
ncbi:hypothetical protein FOPE_00700 [Fonsecaea pedrosoi]|nr:hypothetical protein FOPE_00700 [Fonsecaea pedrosoi]